MLKARQICKGLIGRKIVDGRTINMWLELWLEGETLVDKVI